MVRAGLSELRSTWEGTGQMTIWGRWGGAGWEASLQRQLPVDPASHACPLALALHSEPGLSPRLA